jgi:hypothetical protein
MNAKWIIGIMMTVTKSIIRIIIVIWIVIVSAILIIITRSMVINYYYMIWGISRGIVSSISFRIIGLTVNNWPRVMVIVIDIVII